MKNAFTLIELIFVIVILGVLGAIAIPRLAATRDDANVAKSLSELGVAINDFASYYTASGNFGKVSEMTMVTFDKPNLDLKSGGTIAFETPYGNTKESCISFVFTADGNITVLPLAPNGIVCKNIQKTGTFHKMKTTHIVGGNRVNFK